MEFLINPEMSARIPVEDPRRAPEDEPEDAPKELGDYYYHEISRVDK